MGVYIKGMEMPDNCCNCPLGDASDGWYCKLTGRTYNWGNPNRVSWCPLIPVPLHGRLIDADAMLIASEDFENWRYDLSDLEEFSAGLPTIIPADDLAKTIGKSQDSHEIEEGET